MGHTQRSLEHADQCAASPGFYRRLRIVVPQHGFGQLQVPVAVLVPDKFVDGLRGEVEAVVGDGRFNCFLCFLQARDNPALRETEPVFFILPGAARCVLTVHQDIAGRVPDFIAEVAETLDAPDIELDIAPGRSQRVIGETQGVGTVGGHALGEFAARHFFDARRQLGLHHTGGTFFHQRVQVDAIDQVDRVEYVPLRLGHFLAVAVADHAMYVDLVERYLLAKMQGHHDHPGDPEKDDVKAGDQHRTGVECFQLLGVFRPAQGGKSPQGRGEPGIQYILVLAQCQVVRKAILGAHAGLIRADVDVSLGVIPGGHAMPPPQLSRDTPVLDVAHPGKVGVFPLLRHELDVAVFDFLNGRFGQRFCVHVPLIGEVGLDNHTGAIAPWHLEAVVLYLFQQAQVIQVFCYLLAALEAVHTAVGFGDRVIEGGIVS